MTTATAARAPYATVAELRQLMAFPPGQEQDDVDLQRALDAGQLWIDWFTGRAFGLGAEGVARVVTATEEDFVPLVDLQSTAPLVEVDTDGDRTFATTLVSGQYGLEPLTGPPFGGLRAWPVPPSGTEAVTFTVGQQVRVTGQWGTTDSRGRIPATVNEANLLLGARWFKRREAPFSVLQAVEIGAFQRVPAQDDDVVSLLFSVCLPGSPGALLAQTQAQAAGVWGAAWVMV